jgi:hypothetical protein
MPQPTHRDKTVPRSGLSTLKRLFDEKHDELVFRPCRTRRESGERFELQSEKFDSPWSEGRPVPLTKNEASSEFSALPSAQK